MLRRRSIIQHSNIRCTYFCYNLEVECWSFGKYNSDTLMAARLPLPTSLPLPRLMVTLDVVSLASQGCCNLEMAIPWVLHPWNGLRCGFLGISGVLHP